MMGLLNFIQDKYYKGKWPIPKKTDNWALGLIEGDILQYIHNADERRKSIEKSLTISNLTSCGPIDSFQVTFVGSFYHPIVKKIVIKPEFVKSDGIDFLQNELHEKILTRLVEEVIYLTNESLVRLCFEFILNECKINQEGVIYSCKIPTGNNLWLYGMENMGLSFDHEKKPSIISFSDPFFYGAHILPTLKNVEYTSYGEELSPYTLSIYDIQKKYLKELLP